MIFDWGFWTKEERICVNNYFKNLGINIELHYINVDNDILRNHLQKRNNDIKNNVEYFYHIDIETAEKFWDMYEKPDLKEIDIWIKNYEKKSIKKENE